MQVNIKYAAIAFVFAATPALAAAAPQPRAQASLSQQLEAAKVDLTTAFETFSGTAHSLAKEINGFMAAAEALETENAELKDELARAKAMQSAPAPATAPAPAPTPAPMSTPAPK